MTTSSREFAVRVEGGEVPVHALGPEDARDLPGLVVIPSIFGPAPDLLARLEGLSDGALVVVVDPFWHAGGGAIPYANRDAAFARLRGFDLERCFSETLQVIEWTRARCNGRVAGLGICFGGPPVLHAAAEGVLGGVVTWHGSRMEKFLERAEQITCPLRLHFGGADPISPPDAIAEMRSAFAGHPDVSFVVHPGLVHGYSHEGDSYDEAAARIDLEATRDLLVSLRV